MAERNKYQKILFGILNERPIAFNVGLARMLGSVKAGLLLSQLLWWHEKGNDREWTYKTMEEIKQETALSRKEQDGAIRILKKSKILEVMVKGLPAKRHFKIDFDKIIELAEKHYK